MRRGPEDEATHRGAPLSSHASGRPLREEPLVAIASFSSGGIILPIPERSPFIVGRGGDCDLAISDVSVSRRHLRVTIGDDLRVEDLASANGTSYDSQPLKPYTETVIELGHALTLGSVTVFIHPAQAVIAPGRAAGPGVLFTPPVVEIVHDDASKKLYAMIPTIAPSPLSVLVLGETGVGKEVFADAIHRGSRRAHRPFLKLNCAALPESILEGELFGYERGAFSGAVVARPGLFEAAHGGTVFLDEVGELPLHTQSKLLRVLESGEVMRLGARAPLKIDVRFIAATNRDLRVAMERGEFRSDLFYRLEGIRVEIPPLRARPMDIVALAEFFLARLAGRMGLVAPQLSEGARDVLKDYAWPGNVRELRNTIERALVMNPEREFLNESDILTNAPESIKPPPIEASPPTVRISPAEHPSSSTRKATSLQSSLDEIEEKAIREALAQANGNQSAAARILGIGRHALIKRIEAYGIARPRKLS